MAGNALNGTRSGRQADRNARPLRSPEGPGAVSSPHLPGQVPDHSTVPGHVSGRVPRAPVGGQLLSEDDRTQEVMGVSRLDAHGKRSPAQFEQATASDEELLKAVLADRPPDRHVLDDLKFAGDLPAAVLSATATSRFVGISADRGVARSEHVGFFSSTDVATGSRDDERGPQKGIRWRKSAPVTGITSRQRRRGER